MTQVIHNKMKKLIRMFRNGKPFDDYDEEYKWALLDATAGNDVIDMIKKLRGKNIVDNPRVDTVLKTLVDTQPSELTKCVNHLLDETLPLDNRIAVFKKEMRKLCPSNWKNCANDERTAAAILMCKYPEKYTAYMDTVYQLICQYFGMEIRKPGHKFSHFTDIINSFASEYGDEIQQIMLPQIGKYKNKPLNLAVQTLFWCMKDSIKTLINNETMPHKNYQEYIDLLQETRNLVLTGAPGTGKTYMAKEIAAQMLGLDSTDALKDDKRFGFVQFHPSYDYTDFVEGLRPLKDTQNGVIGFKRQDGVFKEFCKQAIISAAADEETISDINESPTVWKVSLGGTGDNPVRTDCMKNGFIRIGWHQYGDVEDFYDFDDYYVGGKNVLRAYQSGMRIGDIVVSCYSAKEIDAVGVVTGDYEYRAEGGDYPRYRTVRWLVKDIKENILELNGNKVFTLPTVYKANITAESALRIVQKYSTNHKVTTNQNKAVFIIDEINRGEISKIFGELFFSIDPGYRGVKGIVKTQYQNMIEDGDAFKEGFYVPDNVYIIATMNDIDRSVESMDFAMRRRFTWKEITPDDTASMLDILEYPNDAKETMNRLNKVIAETEGLGPAYMIGPSYYLKLGDNGFDYNKLWELNIEPLLKEYVRGFRDPKMILNKCYIAFFDKMIHED